MSNSTSVSLLELLKTLPIDTTLGDVFTATKGRINFAPEKVEDVLAEIEANRAARLQ